MNHGNLKVTSKNFKTKGEETVTRVSEKISVSNDIPSYREMRSSTLRRLRYVKKLIILHDVSNLKIYEEVEDRGITDISAVTSNEAIGNLEESHIYENVQELVLDYN